MFGEPKYCIYLTEYSGNNLPMFYIGSSTVDRVLKKNYRGSVSSKEYKKIWESELKNHPELFKTSILRRFYSRKFALLKEKQLQLHVGVVKSNDFVNKSVASTNGFFGMDVSGDKNPNYNKRLTEEQKKAHSVKMKQVYSNQEARDNLSKAQKIVQARLEVVAIKRAAQKAAWLNPNSKMMNSKKTQFKPTAVVFKDKTFVSIKEYTNWCADNNVISSRRINTKTENYTLNEFSSLNRKKGFQL